MIRVECNKDKWLDAVVRYAGLPELCVDGDLEIYLSAYWDEGYTSASTAKRLLTYLGVKQ